MTSEARFADAALRTWKLYLDRSTKFLDNLSDEQLLVPIAPGKNTLLYIYGHLAAVHDGIFPLLGLGERLHPEYDAPFLKNADGAVEHSVTPQDLRAAWNEIHDKLWSAFTGLTAEQWLERHTAVSPEAFEKEPHRNRYSVLLNRLGHATYHLGQVVLVKSKE